MVKGKEGVGEERGEAWGGVEGAGSLLEASGKVRRGACVGRRRGRGKER